MHELSPFFGPNACPSNRGNLKSSANIGFEAELWRATDKLRSNVVAAEYKHVALELIFLRYIPGQLFYSTHIPVCLWFLPKIKNADAKRGFQICSLENYIALAA